MLVPARPILYSFRRCPYAMRARLALAVSGQHCELREVALRDKPPELLAASPKGTVPVLIDSDGQVLEESLDIMLWALRQRDPEHWLAPGQGSLEAMLELIASFDSDFKFHLDRYKYANRHAGATAVDHRSLCAGRLELLDARLCASQFLFGSHAALADMAIVPFVRQFAHTDKTWFQQQAWPQLQRWLSDLVDGDLYGRIMEKYPKWQ